MKLGKPLILFILLLLTACSSQSTIVHGLDERDANDILVYLDNQGVKAVKVKAEVTGGGAQTEVLWNIAVSPDNEKQAMALLNAAGLPRRRSQSLLNIFERSGLVPSETEQKIRYEAGLAASIASTIRKIDGVVDADIQLSFPQEDPLNPDKPKGEVTASVYVKHTGVLDDPNSQLTPRIRRLVSSAIQGLKIDNVTVIPDRARFADITGRSFSSSKSSDVDLVKVWSVTLAKTSKTRFQILFLVLLSLLFFALFFFVWLLWKVYPLLPGTGLKGFLEPHPFTPVESKVEESVEEETEKGEEEHEAPSDDEDLADIETPSEKKSR